VITEIRGSSFSPCSLLQRVLDLCVGTWGVSRLPSSEANDQVLVDICRSERSAHALPLDCFESAFFTRLMRER